MRNGSSKLSPTVPESSKPSMIYVIGNNQDCELWVLELSRASKRLLCNSLRFIITERDVMGLLPARTGDQVVILPSADPHVVGVMDRRGFMKAAPRHPSFSTMAGS
jgi:hypothetical protein